MNGVDLGGKVALVTGSTRGIGWEVARVLAAHGATVAVNGRNVEETAARSAELAEQTGGKIIGLVGDVTDTKAVSAMVRAVYDQFGRLDILVNNAGVLRDGLIGMIRDEDVQQTIGTNLVGVINCIRAASRLIGRTGGSIINIASIIGVRGNRGQLVYSASKAGVIGATLAAAKELAASNVRVNAVAPGYIDTDMIRGIPAQVHEERIASIAMKRIGRPDDVAYTVLFFASDLSSYVTGQVLGVDGGMLI